jgi:hypothetical protein
MFGPVATEYAEVRHVDVSSLGDSRCGRWQVFLQAFEATLREQLETHSETRPRPVQRQEQRSSRVTVAGIGQFQRVTRSDQIDARPLGPISGRGDRFSWLFLFAGIVGLVSTERLEKHLHFFVMAGYTFSTTSRGPANSATSSFDSP